MVSNDWVRRDWEEFDVWEKWKWKWELERKKDILTVTRGQHQPMRQLLIINVSELMSSILKQKQNLKVYKHKVDVKGDSD